MFVLNDWQNFYVLTGTAAATLIGLLFVAVSISAGRDLNVRHAANATRTFVNPVLIDYFQVFIVSCLALMPLHSSLILGIAVLVLGGNNCFLALKVCWRILVLHRDDMDLGHWIWHFLLPLIAGILFVCTGIGFLWGQQLATLGLPVTALLCLGIGLRNTWELTLWLLFNRGQSGNVSSEEQTTSTDSTSRVG